MEKFYPDLEKIDRAAVARIVRECVVSLRKSLRITYDELANKITSFNESPREFVRVAGLRNVMVSGDAISAFCTRETHNRVNLKNKTFDALYVYLHERRHELPHPVQARLNEQWSVFVGTMPENTYNNDDHDRRLLQSLSLTTQELLHINKAEVAGTIAKFIGKYVMLRKSVSDPDVVIMSNLEIYVSENKDFIRVLHQHTDRHHQTSTSKGFLVRRPPNLYALMRVESDVGLELLALRDPVNDRFRRLLGFLMSMNVDRKLLDARVVIERRSDVFDKVRPRFRVSEIEDDDLRSVVLQYLEPGECRSIIDDIPTGEKRF